MVNIIALLGLLLSYTDKLAEIGALLTKAQNEGRDVTSAELDTLFSGDDAARKALQDAIDNAKARAGV